MTTAARPTRCSPPAPALREFARATFAAASSKLGRHKLGPLAWRANHAGGSGTYEPKLSDFEQLVALGWSESDIRQFCREAERRMLAARRAIHGAPVVSICAVRAAKESGEAVAALMGAVVEPANPTRRQRALAEAREAVTEMETVIDALGTLPPAA